MTRLDKEAYYLRAHTLLYTLKALQTNANVISVYAHFYAIYCTSVLLWRTS
jgi:hypothetical protein